MDESTAHSRAREFLGLPFKEFPVQSYEVIAIDEAERIHAAIIDKVANLYQANLAPISFLCLQLMTQIDTSESSAKLIRDPSMLPIACHVIPYFPQAQASLQWLHGLITT